MNGDEVRDSFIRFFTEKGHLHMPSASLIPAGDPTLLFTSAGMVPFKPFFTGEQTPPARRMTSSQKSFRTTDIDEVGDHKHLTFFEMLGNFSIGDYFKDGAVAFAWELVTQAFQLAPDRIFVTIHLDDDEAFLIWRHQIGVPEDRIYRYGDSDNWWGPAGNEGATGPCSELHYDSGRAKGCSDMVEPEVLTALLLEDRRAGVKAGFPDVPGCHPNCDCERFVELWNLVFMQFYQDPQGTRTPLPAPSVDTGMGLERAAAVLQNKANVYETDLFSPIIDRVCQLSGRTYGADPDADYAIRVVAEHTRAAVFLIGDGVAPGNEGRGYVLRRVIRRAIRYGRRLGLDQPYLTEVAETVLPRFRQTYPELLENHDFILRVIRLEEERFANSFDRGNSILAGMVGYREDHAGAVPEVIESARGQHLGPDDAGAVLERHGFTGVHGEAGPVESIGREIAADQVSRLTTDAFQALAGGRESEDGAPNVESSLETLRAWGTVISAREAFLLYDTYGFPPELTAEIARERGLEVDLEGFQAEMDAQRRQSRASHAFAGSMEMVTAYESLGVGHTRFVGYDGLTRETTVDAILVYPSADSAQGEPGGHAVQGQHVEVVLANTPFYAEGGGQLADRGTITGPNGVVAVEDTQSPVAGLIVHRGVVQQGEISLGQAVTALVDPARRLDASRNHSGTHLLHASLRAVLGPHVRQAGSMVAPERLRFDFSHVSPLSAEEIASVQSLANERIRDNLSVLAHETSYSQAVRDGALAFFGDRYGDVVRVVSMSNGEAFSVEVCGGTHVGATGQVGTLFVLGESSIGGGMRRIEAVTGRAAERMLVDYSAMLDSLARKLQAPVADLEARLDSFMRDADDLRRRLTALERAALRGEAESLLGRVVDVDGVKVAAGRTSAGNSEAMREMGDFLKARLASAVVVLAAVVEGNPLLIAMVTPDLVDRGVHAGNIARDTAKVMGGGGGGRPEMAQAGGRNAQMLEEALRGVPELVRRSLS